MTMTPHKCPVCYGRGFVAEVLYHAPRDRIGTPTAKVQCRTCSGKGLVWSFEITIAKETIAKQIDDPPCPGNGDDLRFNLTNWCDN